MTVLDQAQKELQIPSPVTELCCPLFDRKEVKVFLKRDDLIHPLISGNKWRKLKHNILHTIENKLSGIITFGGAFSNHIIATAKACQLANIYSIGIIRGEKENGNNHTLLAAQNLGMKLIFVSREEYRTKSVPDYLLNLQSEFPNYFIIPEGGANKLALNGIAELLLEQEKNFDYITTACGTGTTLAGLLKGKKTSQEIIGFPVLKNGEFLLDEISSLLDQEITKQTLKTNYHFGGYAKTNPELFTFLHSFEHYFKIEIDPVYTAKHLYGLVDLIKKDYFRKGSNILAIHTGGVQGKEGMKKKLEDNFILNEAHYFS